jgi:hypothetical protein
MTEPTFLKEKRLDLCSNDCGCGHRIGLTNPMIEGGGIYGEKIPVFAVDFSTPHRGQCSWGYDNFAEWNAL